MELVDFGYKYAEDESIRMLVYNCWNHFGFPIRWGAADMKSIIRFHNNVLRIAILPNYFPGAAIQALRLGGGGT